jgi:polar amino acid transport system substrate-binding protein
MLALFFAGCVDPLSRPTNRWEVIQKRGYLKIGATMVFPPQGYRDEKGQLVGFEIDLIKALSQELMGKPDTVSLESTTTANWQTLLNYGKVDFLLASMAYDPIWAKHYVYGKPYYNSVFRILVRKESGIKTLQDMQGKRVTFLYGGTSNRILKANAPKGTKLVGYRTIEDEIIAFRYKMVDGFAQQEAVLQHLLKDQCGVAFLPEKLAPQPYSVMYAKRVDNAVMIDKVEAAMTKLTQNGTIHRLKAKWYKPLKFTECPKTPPPN